VSIAQPDITLVLDMDGVIQDATLSNSILGESAIGLIGRPWIETVGDFGGDKITRMVEDARTSGVSAFREVTQCFPSGLKLPIEYMTVRLGGKAGLIAVGKNLQAVAELQSRLIAAQQAMEQDYWKFREIETRYRLLFDASNEAVLLIKADTLRVVEANPAAIRALGLAPGWEFSPQMAASEHEAFQAMLMRVREKGKAPGIIVHLGTGREAWTIRASLMTGEPGPVFMVQLMPVGSFRLHEDPIDDINLGDLVDRLPDGFVVLDQDGLIRRANRAFLDLVQVSTERSILGERLGRWLSRPGADQTVLMANIQRHQVVRLFSTTIHGELGADAEVEISAAGDTQGKPQFVGVLLRDVSRRLPINDDDNRLRSVLRSITEQTGKASLKKLVGETVSVVEQHYVEAALKLANGNRTAAAELLGVSRQSLYAKLNRYGITDQPSSSD
jgi:transcriptional regulator PpsR